MTEVESAVEPGDLGRLGTFINVGGVVFAALLMIVALIRIAFVGVSKVQIPLSLREILRGLGAGDPLALATVGCLLLIATPMLRVALITGAFARAGRKGFVIIGACVLVILTVSMVISSVYG